MTGEELVQSISDTKLGAGLASAGTAGFTMQSLVEWGNLFVTVGNCALVLGGLYFMAHRVRSTYLKNKRRDRRTED